MYMKPGRRIDVGGFRINIRCIGHGTPTVILEAGWEDWSPEWALVQPEVARFARVCTYDRAGYGFSDA